MTDESDRADESTYEAEQLVATFFHLNRSQRKKEKKPDPAIERIVEMVRARVRNTPPPE